MKKSLFIDAGVIIVLALIFWFIGNQQILADHSSYYFIALPAVYFLGKFIGKRTA